MEIEKHIVIGKPYTKVLPIKRNYGIDDDIEEKLIYINKKFKGTQNIKAIIIFTLIIILSFLLGLLRTNNINKAFICSFISIFPSIIFFLLIMNKRAPKTSLHRAYEKYKEDINNYKYWNGKDKNNYWHSLTGIGFEYALAELFNLYGYRTALTKASGDKGVDIILEKDYDILIVQCKAHKVKISPNVARKLYDSMKYFGIEKSILASVSGFTSGVYEYVYDKNIELIETNDILEMMNELET